MALMPVVKSVAIVLIAARVSLIRCALSAIPASVPPVGVMVVETPARNTENDAGPVAPRT